MYCPNCQTSCEESDHFCYLCGAPLHPEYLPTKPKKGSRWVPLLLLVLMTVVGLISFFATSGHVTPSPAENRTQPFIGAKTFYHCAALEAVHMNDAFGSCNSLGYIIFYDGNHSI